MFPPDVQLCGELFTQQIGFRSSIDEDGKVMPVYFSDNSWSGCVIPELGLSGVIFPAR
jgi:hypothetical protein